ncbi:MAG: nucleotidyltransferase family protein [Betaproteobacteria bacterium]|nr:nucleotidyltransferase family protein [Betaproteobacteria bacterium]
MIAGILLAAGRSTRFGSDKLLQAEPQGLPLALQAARAFAPLEQTRAVIPAGNGPLRALFESIGLSVTEVAGTAALSRSLKAGLEASAQARGWIVGLADMPCVRPSTVAAIRQALEQGADIVACRHEGRRGNPAGFSQNMKAALLALEGDQGARRLLEECASAIYWLDVDDPGILLDIDVPADWAQFAASFSRTA